MKKILVAGLVLGLSAFPAMAEYTVKGSVECPDIVKEDANENYREYNKWWLLGYFTARNFMVDKETGSGQAGKGVENDNIYAMALDFCRSNPASDWDDAAIHVYDLLD